MCTEFSSPGDVMLVGEHFYLRPSWSCQGCGEPWPCARARADLMAQYRPERISLAIYLGAVLADALHDGLGTSCPEALYHRMLGWIRP
ncbi:hypothetical protein AMIS_61310 [Actinoplanes missouriensis 431]|uniref:Flavin reductase n=1 Tax=Actinoplanes missouriensis (strain ATCC 14538 / DSM 43046 / CBS 188.64 / JCM 3121 / NBRC 102363 / NCIMB 12654 / NRRL B-3342 / UNCC 431) TaxID=512565 RepID=I0HEB4_ACTM4|nr:hypothetical protein AMIS_61310 [Actinoplanes missouriensis 431]